MRQRSHLMQPPRMVEMSVSQHHVQWFVLLSQPEKNRNKILVIIQQLDILKNDCAPNSKS